MADNVSITAGAGTVVATDDAGAGGHVQIVKLAISADGSATVLPVTAANGLLADVSRIQGTVTTTPSSAGDVGSTLTDGRKTVPSAGTAVALVASSTPCKWVIVTALLTNTTQVNVGGSGALATVGGSTGTPLQAGQSVTLPVSNANLVFVDARTTGEGVSYTVGS